jgi:phosphoenolpyruvate synthase/pyruvate phosphate dikinase
MKPPVLWLKDPGSQGRDLTGNKCATLALLADLGYDVPDGFCVTTDAISAGPEAYREAVVEALARLQSPWVARSSATVEDAAGHRFPGLFSTQLGLDREGSLLQAIEEVGASASAVVKAYAERLGVDPTAIRMAVLVQSLVPATVAGVAFSRDPVSGQKRVVIEANHGLGTTVVEGSVEPDRFLVGAGGEVSRSLGSKRRKAVFAPGSGVIRVETSDAERSSLALDDGHAALVATAARRLEADLGYPVDVEWALADGRLRVLQARPFSHGPERSS